MLKDFTLRHPDNYRDSLTIYSIIIILPLYIDSLLSTELIEFYAFRN